MNCVEFQEIAGLYALGALDAPEQREARAHLAAGAHQGCPESLREAKRGWEALPLSLDPLAVEPRLWSSIEQSLTRAGPLPRAPPQLPRAEPPLPRAETPLPRGQPTRRRWREPLGWAAAAALLLALLGVDQLRRREQRRGDLGERLAREQAAAAGDQQRDCARQIEALGRNSEEQRFALELLRRPGVRVVPLQPQQGAQGGGSALLDLEHKQGALVSGGLPAQPGHDYELWIIRGAEKIPAGLLGQGSAIVLLDERLLSAGVDALAVTVEPSGGSPQPTGAIVLLGAVKS